MYEYSIAVGATINIQVISLVDVYLEQFTLSNWTSAVRLELRSGATQAGSFSSSLPNWRTNQTTGPDYSYTSRVTLQTGGTSTGGTLLDVIQLASGNKDNSVVGGDEDPIGMPPATYNIIISNTSNSTATGTFKARWEERP
jgi:hypothetical protein